MRNGLLVMSIYRLISTIKPMAKVVSLGRVEHSQIVSVSAMVEGSTRPSD